MSDILIWNTIGGKKFCSFKKKITANNFCRNAYNISGLCSRQACPLANSRYATVLEIRGKLYLFVKTPERAHTPVNLWERIPLHPNFLRALAQINAHLQFWPRFIRKRAKLRLTRIHQYLIRMRRMHGKQRVERIGIHKKTEKQDQKREEKAHRAAQLQDTIKHELLNRLREGTYGDLYNDIVNYNTKQFTKALNDEEEEEDLEFDWLEEEESAPKQQKKGKTFVEAYSDEDDDEEEEDEEELNYEYEFENEGQKRKERIRQGQAMMNDMSDDDDDDDDGDDDIDVDSDEFDGEDLDYEFDEDDEGLEDLGSDFDDYDSDNASDIEDQVHDSALMKSKKIVSKQSPIAPVQSKSTTKAAPVSSKVPPKAAAAARVTTTNAASKIKRRGRGVDDE